MSRRKTFVVAVVFLMAGLVFGLTLSSNLGIHSNGYSEDIKISKESVDLLSRFGEAMSEVAAAVQPAVVNISSTRIVKEKQRSMNPFFDDPFFRRFFGDEFQGHGKPRERKSMSLGSGVIVDSDGYVLTNNHVVKDADEITVTLSDKREFKGKVLGTDPKTDIAVVKIDSDHLPTVKWGNSDKLKVGELVIAIGSPYGLNRTVTSGIVSATGRADVGIADYEDFIQTDAAINPGNSGGALVNTRGELVGINTAIFSTTGGYQGIGFAIPSNMAKTVLDSLVKSGKVVRGWIGVWIQPVTKELAEQFKIEGEKGVIVSDIFEDSPAEKAGIQRGDVIVEYEGKGVDDPVTLRNMVAATAPGTKVKVVVVRDGKRKTLDVVITEQKEDQKLLGQYENVLNGVHVQNLTPELRKSLSLPARLAGVLVTDVESGSPAEGVLSRGDVILEINRKKIENLDDYESVVSKISPKSDMLLLIYKDGRAIYQTLSP